MSVARQPSENTLSEFHAKIADCTLRFVVDSPDLQRELIESVSLFSLAASFDDAPEADFTINFNRQEASSLSVTMPLGASYFEVESGDCLIDGETCLLKFGDSTIFIESSRTKNIYVLYQRSEDFAFVFPLLIKYAIQLGLHRRHRFHLHSAAVVNPYDNRGALLIGDSGSGKSTLTVQLARAGWNYLSDDVVILSPLPTGVHAFWRRRFFSLTETTVNACDVNQADEIAQKLKLSVVPQDSKQMFMPEDLFGHPPLASCLPNRLFFVGLSHQPESIIKRMTAGEALLTLIKKCGWATHEVPDVARAFIRTLENLINQCCCYELSSGYDVLENFQRAARLISETEGAITNRKNV